jgi:hypothetical protein
MEVALIKDQKVTILFKDILNVMQEIVILHNKIETEKLSKEELYSLKYQRMESIRKYIFLVNGNIKKSVWYLYESGNDYRKGGKYYFCKDILDKDERTITNRPEYFDYVITPLEKYYDSNTTISDVDRLIMYKNIRDEYFRYCANCITLCMQTDMHLNEMLNDNVKSINNFVYKMNNIK